VVRRLIEETQLYCKKEITSLEAANRVKETMTKDKSLHPNSLLAYDWFFNKGRDSSCKGYDMQHVEWPLINNLHQDHCLIFSCGSGVLELTKVKYNTKKIKKVVVYFSLAARALVSCH